MHLQAILLFNNDIGYHFGHVDTKSKVISDRISRIPSKSALMHNVLFPFTVPMPHWLSVLLPKGHHHLLDYGCKTGSIDALAISRLLLPAQGSFISSPGTAP